MSNKPEKLCDLGRAIDARLTALNMTQRDLARRLEMDDAALTRVMQGLKRFSGPRAEAVSQILELPMNLFGLSLSVGEKLDPLSPRQRMMKIIDEVGGDDYLRQLATNDPMAFATLASAMR